jgi:hypothetical protein
VWCDECVGDREIERLRAELAEALRDLGTAIAQRDEIGEQFDSQAVRHLEEKQHLIDRINKARSLSPNGPRGNLTGPSAIGLTPILIVTDANTRECRPSERDTM